MEDGPTDASPDSDEGGNAVRRWRDAMAEALYRPGDGFFTRPGPGPAGHFRTSAHTGPTFARAIATLIADVDAALGHPERLDVVDVGAGRGELLTLLLDQPRAPRTVSADGGRTRAASGRTAATLSPGGTTSRRTSPACFWRPSGWTTFRSTSPFRTVDGWRYVLVDDVGDESPGPPVDARDEAWIARWWPAGERVEIGDPRDRAWADAIAHIDRGLALAIDYGHTSAARPPLGTLDRLRRRARGSARTRWGL